MADGGKVARKPGERWEAKFPEFTERDGLHIAPQMPSRTPKKVNWQFVTAFQESHLHSFAYDDARIRKPFEDTVERGADGKLRIIEDRRVQQDTQYSRIFVRFKATKRNPIVGYMYESENHPFMKHVYQAMCIANNAAIKGRGPGVALHAYLEQNPEVSYAQMSALPE
jgi:hypothetical protein